jgi:4-amino-4-deoxy-L-arabinose transferase-like glycosyltransferase
MRLPWSHLAAVALLAIFLTVSLRQLDSVPQVYEDEPWQASVAYKLATHGVFGSDLFAGFFGMEQRYYGFMPLHPLLLAADFKIFGVGLEQARLETVFLTAITLILTFALGARLFTPSVGALAVALLVLVRWTGLTYVQLSGIPVVDFARIARYDPLVPVLGLAALHVYLSARRHATRTWLYVVAGVAAGLSGLAHVYGLFWVPILVVLALADRRARYGVWIGAGAILPWVPYAAYVLSDLPDWRGQTAIYAGRFELLNPGWYLHNILEEYHRYGPGLGPFGVSWLSRPGFWLVLTALPVSLVFLTRRALRCDAAARAVVVPALALPLGFAVLITLKLVNYTLIELPLFALATAWGTYALWRAWPRLRPLMVALAVAVGLEGGLALSQLERASTNTTPYPTFQDFDYRSFLVPLNFADLGTPLDQALSDVDPDIVLLDARMRAYFQDLPPGGDGDRFRSWLASHSGEVIARVDDPTYGLMEIYRVKR